MKLRGTVTALATPFTGGAPDTGALRRLVAHQIENGVEGLLACGCTGEPATMSEAERLLVMETVVDQAEGAVPVLGGTGTNSTESTIRLTRDAAKTGINGVLVITPYYNKPTPAGQVAHFTAVADASELPVMIYNVPGRTGTCMTVETIATLSGHGNITALKDAAGSVERITEIRRACPIALFSGDDHLALPQSFMGSDGVVSVTSNVAPAAMGEMIRQGLSGNVEVARRIHERLFPLFRALFTETSPGPVKMALYILGIFPDPAPRLPLVSVGKPCVEALLSAMKGAGVIE
ncbi:MAG: 4-hydroxy-tetrahydrodipicolinate synthase [Candidatus Fermentibacteraceae bacterium]